MVQYMIITSKYNEIFNQKIRDTKQSPLKLMDCCKANRQDETTFFKFEVSSREKKVLLEQLATLVSDIIQSQILVEFAKTYLKNKEGLKKEEKKEIANMFILNNYVAKEEGVSYISYYLLYTPILKALEEYRSINIDGWILFRTHQYKIILEDILEQTIYDYKTQKDYLRFVNLLRESKRIQQSLESTLHLVLGSQKEMRILNTNKKDITEEYIKIYCKDLVKEELTHEDCIMNIFMTICPENVVIHNKKAFINVQFIETLEKIFEDQIQYCEGCALCTNRENLLSD